MYPKKVLFLLFWPFLRNSCMDRPNFLHDCRGQWGVSFELHFLFEKNILDYRGLSVPFLRLLAFSSKRPQGFFSIICMIVEDYVAHYLS